MVFGIIGGIGTGKSLISSIIEEEYGAYYINADKMGHDLLKKGSKCYDEIVASFGVVILNEAGEINRKTLSNIVFSNKDNLDRLNKIVHPVLKEEIRSLIMAIKRDEKYQFIILEAAILIEANWADLVDEIILVTCDLEIRLQRLFEYRQLLREKALSIIDDQMSEDELKGYSHYIIDNSYDINKTRQQVRDIMMRIKA